MNARPLVAAMAGACAGALYGVVWMTVFEESMGGCDMGCLAALPLYPGLVLSTLALGAWSARPASQHPRAGWSGVGVLGLVALLKPMSVWRILVWPASSLEASVLTFGALVLGPAVLVVSAYAVAAGAARVVSRR